MYEQGFVIMKLWKVKQINKEGTNTFLVTDYIDRGLKICISREVVKEILKMNCVSDKIHSVTLN